MSSFVAANSLDRILIKAILNVTTYTSNKIYSDYIGEYSGIWKKNYMQYHGILMEFAVVFILACCVEPWAGKWSKWLTNK